MSMHYDVAVSIINYRTAELTLQCVRSVLADLKGIHGFIVVVDNFSDDGSAETIQTWIDTQPDTLPVKLIRSPINSGFSGGHNLGIGAAQADHYLVLNSDAVLRGGFFDAILRAAENNPKAGIIAPQIQYDDGQVQESCFRFPGPRSELIRSARTGPVTKLLTKYDTSLGPHPDPLKIEWASFACVLLRASMVGSLGPMDEGYFLYFEDVEYALRARRAGWGVVQAPGAVAVHYRGGSGPVKSLNAARARLPRYFYSSRTRFLYQAYGIWGPVASNLMWYLGRAINRVARILGKSPSPMALAEGRDIWTNTRNPLGPRYAPWEAE